MFFILPWCVIISIFGAIYFIRKRDINTHVTLVIHLIIILSSVAIYRCVIIEFLIVIAFTSNNQISHINLVPDNLPIDGLAIITYGLLIMLCCLSLSQFKTFKAYIMPLCLSIALLYSLCFIPWVFFGVIDINSYITQPGSLLKGFIQAVE